LEAAECKLAEDGDAVGPVEADGADVEDAEDGLWIGLVKTEGGKALNKTYGIVTQGDEIDGNAPEDGNPNGI
jgi:hypothetical protein